MSILDRCRESRRHAEEDEGFTLIELLVVLLIIGILLAIAIPTFLSVTKGANGTAAQANLQTALTGADSYYTDANQSYIGLLEAYDPIASNISQVDTGLTYVSGATQASTSAHTISIAYTSSVLVMTNFAPGQNDCWGITDIKSTQTSGTASNGYEAVGTYYWVLHGANSNTGCNAATLASDTAASTTGFAISPSKFPSA